MWFKLAGATFTNNLGTMDSISKSYMMDYSGLTGLSASPGSVSYASDSTPDATITFTVKSGYVFKSGSTVTASGGASQTYTASADIAAGSSFAMALTNISNKVTFVGAAELVSSGGSSSGGGEPETPGTPESTIPNHTVRSGNAYSQTAISQTNRASSSKNIYLKAGDKIGLTAEAASTYKFALYNQTSEECALSDKAITANGYTTNTYSISNDGWYGVAFARANNADFNFSKTDFTTIDKYIEYK